jgi:hypothetical protein
MAKTALEKRIKHKRHRSGILVPLIEDFLLRPVRIQTAKDKKFLNDLFEKNMQREKDRETERLFSPSMLAECLREVFLAKNFEELGIERQFSPRIEPHFYFLTGEFLHLKWQYVIYKMAQKTDDIVLATDPIDSFEVRVFSKRGDHGGTADVVPFISGAQYVVDFKGLNVRSFSKISRGDVPGNYRIQTTDYMMLLNSERPRRFYDIADALLVCENKGGPDVKHPAALCEARISLSENRAEVRGRLEELRRYEAQKEIPPPECVSTKGIQFTGCYFSGFCKKEVKAIENRKSEDRNANGYKVAVPSKRRANRARGNRK